MCAASTGTRTWRANIVLFFLQIHWILTKWDDGLLQEISRLLQYIYYVASHQFFCCISGCDWKLDRVKIELESSERRVAPHCFGVWSRISVSVFWWIDNWLQAVHQRCFKKKRRTAVRNRGLLRRTAEVLRRLRCWLPSLQMLAFCVGGNSNLLVEWKLFPKYRNWWDFLWGKHWINTISARIINLIERGGWKLDEWNT